jgi:hypothetical protein
MMAISMITATMTIRSTGMNQASLPVARPIASDKGHQAERRAARDLLEAKPATMAGASALTDYLGTLFG